MFDVLSTSEAASALGVSERRVRALISNGQLPAQRFMGRWAIPTDAVKSGSVRPEAGRPMAEETAWTILRLLSGASLEQPSEQLQHRIPALFDAPEPVEKVISWVSRRGVPVRVVGSAGGILSLLEDERVVISGGHAIAAVATPSRLRVYVSSTDVSTLLDDYDLRRVVVGSELPNATLWAVSDLNGVPRSPINPRLAAAPVAAIDLLEDGSNEGATTIATRIIAAAVGALEHARTAKTSNRGGRRRRPHAVVDTLDTLHGPTNTEVNLPISLDWGPNPVYDLSDEAELRECYRRVLNESLTVEQLETYLDKATLLREWHNIKPASEVRFIWENRFPELASGPPKAVENV